MNDFDEPRPSKPACTEPRLGAALSQRLGTPHPLPPSLAAHLQDCLACQVEQHEFRTLDQTAVELPVDFLRSLRQRLDDLR